MHIRAADRGDLDNWARLRTLLWPRLTFKDHRVEVAALLERPAGYGAFLATTDEGEATGFVEVSVRHDYVNGCKTSPVAFLEGVFVLGEYRSQGTARRLVDAVVAWADERDLSELASDADIANETSHHMHRALGFEETGKVVFFRRNLR